MYPGIELEERRRLKQTAGQVAELVVHAGVVDSVEASLNSESLYSQQNLVMGGLRGGHDVIVKIYPSQAYGNAIREADSLTLFAAAGIPVAPLLARGVLPDNNLPYLVLGRLKGRAIASLIGSPHAPPARVGLLAASLLSTQAGFQRFALLDDPALRDFGFVELTFRRLMQLHGSGLIRLGLPHSRFAEIECWIQGLEDPYDFGWVTFDWRLRHLLWDQGSITGLLDLEYTKPYDTLIDVANLCHDVIFHTPVPYARQLLNALLERYQQLRGPLTPSGRERLRYYLVRQALGHAHTKWMQGIRDARIARELRFACFYFDSGALESLLDGLAGCA